MSQDKEQIKPEEPVDETTRKRAAQKKASEESEDEEQPISREQAEKEMREAIQRVKRGQKPKQ